MASQLLNKRNVADPETKEKPPRVSFSQSILSGNSSYGITGVNICNAGGNDYSARCA